MVNREENLRSQIINTGKKLYDLRLVTARAGNLSCRLDDDNILITATGTSLGNLMPEEIIKVNLALNLNAQDKNLSTEFPLHRLIYKNFPFQAVIHCHPPLVNGYFSVSSSLKALTFETKLFLGDIPVIEQETPSITRPELAICALRNNNLVVIKNHGVVSVGKDFTEALYLIESLEEAVKVTAIARLFNKEALDNLDKELKETLKPADTTEANIMFSPEHIRKIVSLVNQDDFISQKGKELDLTLQLAIKLEEENKAYRFTFERGRITHLDPDIEDAPFVISANRSVWESVFLGKVDPFVATTQGRMKLKGELGKLSRWYVPFSRLFELFKQVKIK